MVTNNIEKDIKIKCLEEDLTQAQLADKIGTTAPYVSCIIIILLMMLIRAENTNKKTRRICNVSENKTYKK